jgi:hypothetical protein
MAITEINTPEGSDPLDSTGRRCDTRVGGVGLCHRRFDHVAQGDRRHWAIGAGQWYEYVEEIE